MGRLGLIIFIAGWLPADQLHKQEVRTELIVRDVHGKPVKPFPKTKPSVLFFTTFDCPVANKMVPEIRRITQTYKGKVAFTLVYADPQTTKNELATHQKDFGLTEIRSVLDNKHHLVKATGTEVTPEAVIVNKGQIVYRGRINNYYEDFGKPRRVITQHDLRNAIDAVLANKKVPPAQGECIGCYIPKLK